MMQFKVTFHRYKNGQSRLSAPTFISAADFNDATTRALLMRAAMADVDLSSIFLVASIESVGLRGDECATGWETQEEFSARVLLAMRDEEVQAECRQLYANKRRSDSEERRFEVVGKEMERRNLTL